MNTALIEKPTREPELVAAERALVKPPAVPSVTNEQLELIKRTVAKDATPDELKLYLYDCARQGVHPLDKLIHFTKRSGKYTPITSIDFMRIRAAESGEYAGSDDAVFSVCEHCGGENIPGPDVETFAARVTVWRLVQGTRCSFTATARWSEYKPDQNDFMWKKMPHTMLAKCAEALALRKGFPRQLAGLYAAEELDQANRGGYSVEAPAATVSGNPAGTSRENASAPSAGEVSGHSVTTNNYATTQNTAPKPSIPDGCVRLERIDSSPTKNKNVTKYFVTLSTGEQVTTIKTQLAALCEQLVQENAIVTVDTKKTQYGTDLIGVHRVERAIQLDRGFGELPADPPF